jgi:hypothetical protein
MEDMDLLAKCMDKYSFEEMLCAACVKKGTNVYTGYPSRCDQFSISQTTDLLVIAYTYIYVYVYRDMNSFH